MDLLLLPCQFCGRDIARHENRANHMRNAKAVKRLRELTREDE
jgi:hypothetical protein